VERANGSVIDGSVEKRVGERVTVLVTDNGPEVDEEVRILDESGNELGRGALTIHSVFRVTGFTGTVSQVTFGENMLVNAASILFNLTDTGYSAHYNSVLKQRKEKEKTLLALLGLYQGGALRAPFDGSILRIDYDENDKTAAAADASAATASQSGMSSYGMYAAMGSTATAASSAAATSGTTQEDEDGIVIVTMAPDVSMLVNISVDEADILSLEVGQAAEVTIESVGENHFDGTVTDVDRTANSSGGVTTYSAEITFAKEKGMLSGMSADVIVNIQGDENVLIVPADAIHRTSAGAFVYTSYDEETKTFGGNMPVEVGISNDDYAEIRSGIEEGTTVYYTEKEENNFYMMMGGPGMNGRPGNYGR
jgi:multidrug efflux pump subunit AcrA (membrane-fusion protein)